MRERVLSVKGSLGVYVLYARRSIIICISSSYIYSAPSELIDARGKWV